MNHGNESAFIQPLAEMGEPVKHEDVRYVIRDYEEVCHELSVLAFIVYVAFMGRTVSNPTLFRVRVMYVRTGTMGVYTISPSKYSGHRS